MHRYKSFLHAPHRSYLKKALHSKEDKHIRLPSQRATTDSLLHFATVATCNTKEPTVRTKYLDNIFIVRIKLNEI